MKNLSTFGEVAQAMYGDARVLRSPRGIHSRAALDAVGEAFQQHFRNKILEGGPGWPPLSATTIKERDRYGMMNDTPLYASGQLYEAIDFKVDTSRVGGAVFIGVRDIEHHHPNGKDFIAMEDLVIIHEMGVSGVGRNNSQSIPPRPIFTSSDFDEAQERIARAFIAITMFSKTGRRSGSMFSKV